MLFRSFTQVFPEYWLYVLGLLFILVTLFMPNGIVGLIRDRLSNTGKKEAA